MDATESKTTQHQALVIEDDSLLKGLFQRWLEHLGYGVRGCVSGAEALALLEADCEAVHLIVLDQHLSDTDGATLYPELRKLRPDARIVLCSAFEPEGILAAEYRARKIGRVKKPCYLAEFRAALAEAGAAPLPAEG